MGAHFFFPWERVQVDSKFIYAANNVLANSLINPLKHDKITSFIGPGL